MEEDYVSYDAWKRKQKAEERKISVGFEALENPPSSIVVPEVPSEKHQSRPKYEPQKSLLSASEKPCPLNCFQLENIVNANPFELKKVEVDGVIINLDMNDGSLDYKDTEKLAAIANQAMTMGSSGGIAIAEAAIEKIKCLEKFFVQCFPTWEEKITRPREEEAHKHKM